MTQVLRFISPFVTVIIFGCLLSCATDSEEELQPLTSWTVWSNTISYVKSLAVRSESTTLTFETRQGMHVYFFTEEVNCDTENVFHDFLYNNERMKVFYPANGTGFDNPTDLEVDSDHTGGTSFSIYYTGSLTVESTNGTNMVTGSVNIKEEGFNEDTSIVGTFEATLCDE